MVRKYVKKRTQKYNQNVINVATKSVRDGSLTLLAASTLFDVPRSTLRRHLDKKLQPVGVRSIFTPLQEKHLASRVIYLAERGFPMRVEDLCSLAYAYGKKLHRRKKLLRPLPVNWHTTKKATYDWLCGFRSRHLEITLRIPEGLSASRAQAFNKKRVESFFEQYLAIFNDLDMTDFPNLIYNVDETGLTSVPTISPKVLAKKGQRSVVNLKVAERGTLTTFVPCSNAIGSMIPPFLIFKGQTPPPITDFPEDSRIVCSKKGWMDQFTFLVFLEHFEAHRVHIAGKKCVLVMDGHKTHVTIEAVDFALDHGIELVCIPPHTSHRLQPMDTHFNSPLKKLWSKEVSKYLKTSDQVVLRKFDFYKMFNPVWTQMSVRRSLFVEGFGHCGLYPCRNPTTSADFLVNLSFCPSGDTTADQQTPTMSMRLLRNLAPSPQKECDPVHLKPHTAVITSSASVVALKERKRNHRPPIPSNNPCHSTLKKLTRIEIDYSVVPCCSSSITNPPSNVSTSHPKSKKSNNKCCVCFIPWSSAMREDWLKCTSCGLWACETCFLTITCVNCE